LTHRRIHFIANCVYGDHLAGGDIHFFEMARVAAEVGYEVNFFGGHALQAHIAKQSLPASIALTEQSQIQGIDLGTFRGQISLFSDYFKRYRGTMRRLEEIQTDDLVYATTDYWFDVLPVIKSRAQRKMMIWHMQAPSFAEIVARSRADVDSMRLASLHYWMSQNQSLNRFCRCKSKQVLYVHPNMRQPLLARGCRSEEIKYISFGVDPHPKGIGVVRKQYDIVWIGRVHRQKGIDDLLHVLQFLAQKLPDFRGLIIGKVKADLQPRIEAMGLAKVVEFSGFVSEEEKFRLFNASRVYLMPSRFEGSPRVVGEALVCKLPVVAYDVPTYRPIFREFLRYVPCYDVGAFSSEAYHQILKMRSGENYLDRLDVTGFIQECSWETARRTFIRAIQQLVEGTQP
jgi:glycosyltransferase involved in cell wall biosynthesis